MSTPVNRNAQCYLVGGGIASMASAVFLIRDAHVSGDSIHIYEQLESVGGSLDGSGGPVDGYLVRGGRMFEKHFACTFDLLSTIPSADDKKISVKDDIFMFNDVVHGRSECRLVRNGEKADMSDFGLSHKHMLDLNRVMLHTEKGLSGRTIKSCFRRSFFDTNFWIMWSTMFSFQPWHAAVEMRRYLRRFIHLFPGFKRIEGILRTRYNQYDSFIEPMANWLSEQGVHTALSTTVTDIVFADIDGKRQVTSMELEHDGRQERITVNEQDRVFITLGTMTGSSTCGSNELAPPLPADGDASWSLWRKLANRYADFGNPETFCSHSEKTGWASFTVTLDNDAFITFMEGVTGNRTGTGGLVTFLESGWMMSIVMFHQPHFREQVSNKYVFWGYGLRADRIGDVVRKPMYECTGLEILQELSGQLKLDDKQANFFLGAKVVSCRMPYITSQFMPRRTGDRPAVVPKLSRNYALIGQYCEVPRDTVFTVEYSVRTAMRAVHQLTSSSKAPPRVHRSDLEPAVLMRAVNTLMRG